MAKQTVYKPATKPKQVFPGTGLTPPKFTPSYYEWLFKDAERIIKSHSSVGSSSTNTLYTVPDNKIFYLTSIALSGTCRGGGGAGAFSLLIYLKSTTTILVGHYFDPSIAGNNSISNQYNPPMRIEQGEDIVNAFESSRFGFHAIITGFLVEKSIIQNL